MKHLVYICSTGITGVEENGPLTFPYLEELVMDGLENLEVWHEKDNKVVAFSILQELDISNCRKLTSLLDTPWLRNLRADHPGRIKLLHINMPMLEPSKFAISLNPLHYFRKGDLIGPPINVKTMEVKEFENVIPVEEGDEESCQQMTLRRLEFWRKICVIFGGPSNMSFGFWKYFGNLEELHITWCHELSHWPKQEFRYLKCLKQLYIHGCENFTCSSEMSSSTKEYGGDFLPRLENLAINKCPKLVKIPNSCSKSLKVLSIWNCDSLSKEGLNWLTNLQELRELKVARCEGLKSLPDGLDCLISLMRLIIIECSRIKSFPEGLQQRLSQLQYLAIIRCPALEERCGSRGDYQHLVSAIPRKVFNAMENPNLFFV